jgi:DNA-binding CsgD family transcriptional regulator
LPDLELTPRQSEVVSRVARGLANKQIASELGISERAVKGHVSDLLGKFGVANRAGLIAALMAARGLGLPRDVTRPDVAPGLEAALGPGELEAYRDAPIMVAVTLGPKHRYAFVNAMSARVAGRATPSLVGKTLREAYPEIDAGYESALDAVYATGVPWAASRAPARFPHDDGTYRDALLHLMFAPIRDRAGTIVGILHIGSEVEDEESA